ncbi:MAG: metallophosphoesterase [Polyangia bacterium]
MSLVLAHISDLHVSRFGEHVTSLRTRAMHGTRAKEGKPWELLGRAAGWRIEHQAHTIRLVDDFGIVHATRRCKPSEHDDMLAQLSMLALERTRTEHSRLAARLPSQLEVEQLLVEDPGNTNLLFCRLAHRLRVEQPDWIVLTGDVTDDGVGYDLVLAGLAPFVARGRVLAIPGNHDIYDSPWLVVPGHARKKRVDKRAAFSRFAADLGLPPTWPWVRELADGIVMCGLDSCLPARTPLSASGAIDPAALTQLRDELAALPEGACKLAMLHHHVVNPPTRAIGIAPLQLGLRLRNARQMYDWFCQERFAGVFNGHRHLGYRYHPSHAPLFVSAPSSTLGCRSGAAPGPFYWRVEIVDRQIRSVTERKI